MCLPFRKGCFTDRKSKCQHGRPDGRGGGSDDSSNRGRPVIRLNDITNQRALTRRPATRRSDRPPAGRSAPSSHFPPNPNVRPLSIVNTVAGDHGDEPVPTNSTGRDHPRTDHSTGQIPRQQVRRSSRIPVDRTSFQSGPEPSTSA